VVRRTLAACDIKSIISNGNASSSLTNLSWVLVGSLLAVATALRDSVANRHCIGINSIVVHSTSRSSGKGGGISSGNK
jgi:hypothetical protein